MREAETRVKAKAKVKDKARAKGKDKARARGKDKARGKGKDKARAKDKVRGKGAAGDTRKQNGFLRAMRREKPGLTRNWMDRKTKAARPA